MNHILTSKPDVCNNYVNQTQRNAPELLDCHARAKSNRVQRDLDYLFEQYRWSWVAATSIDHPASKHSALQEAEKAVLREARFSKLADIEQKYLDARSKEEKRRYKEQLKNAREAAKQLPAAAPLPILVQAKLFEDTWPQDFEYIAERFPHKPFVTNDLEYGVTVRPRSNCYGWKYIQYNNPIYDHLLIIDYDAPNGLDMLKAIEGLPRPTWISRTVGTQRGHIAWSIAVPVLTTSASKLKPLQYLARIEEGYRKHVNGDRGFAGLLTKNPIADFWDVQWIEPKPYTLDELASAVKIERYTSKKKAEAIEPVGLGRKVLTFHRARQWAYSSVSDYWKAGEEAWHAAVASKVEEISCGFEVPLPDSHCRSIAKSIAGWVWKRFTPLTKHQLVLATHTPEVQARRGRMGGKASGVSRKASSADKRARAVLLRAEGMTYKAIAAELGVSIRAAHSYCNETI